MRTKRIELEGSAVVEVQPQLPNDAFRVPEREQDDVVPRTVASDLEGGALVFFEAAVLALGGRCPEQLAATRRVGLHSQHDVLPRSRGDFQAAKREKGVPVDGSVF